MKITPEEQQKFNEMLRTAIATMSPGGFFTSKWSGEEIDRRLGALSIYDYAVAGGYKGTEAEFQALMGSGPWVPGRRAELDGKLNARVAQIFNLTEPNVWCKFGEIYDWGAFSLYAIITNMAVTNPLVPNLGFLCIGGNMSPSIMNVSGKLVYLMKSSQFNGRIVVGRDRGLYAIGGTYSSIECNAIRARQVTIYNAPVKLDAAPSDIMWDSNTASDTVALNSQLAAAVQEGFNL